MSRIGDLEIREVRNGFMVMGCDSHCGPSVQGIRTEMWVFQNHVDLGEFVEKYYQNKTNKDPEHFHRKEEE